MCQVPLGCGLFGFELRFGSVTGFFKPASSLKPRPSPKIRAAHRYIFSVNAPSNTGRSERERCGVQKNGGGERDVLTIFWRRARGEAQGLDTDEVPHAGLSKEKSIISAGPFCVLGKL